MNGKLRFGCVHYTMMGSEIFDYRLASGVYIVTGPSGCGKSHLVTELCTRFAYYLTPFEHNPPTTVALVYATYQPIYNTLLNSFPATTKKKLYQSVDETLADGSAFGHTGHHILFIDDAQMLLANKQSAQNLAKISVQTAHHSNVIVFLVLQNFYSVNNALTTVRRNSRGIFILPYVSDSLSSVLQREYFQNKSRIISEALELASTFGHRFIYIDCGSRPKYRLRLGLGPLENAVVLQML